MDRSIRRLFVFFVLIFVGLVVQLTYVQVWAAPRLNTDAYNTRGVERQMRVERGLILGGDGSQLAANRKEGAYFLREYPEGSLMSPWLGYSSLRYGRAGVERAYNPELSGDSDLLSVRNFLDLVTGRPTRGADLRLTLDPTVQRVAVEALGENVGAVVALDPRTGAVLAWAVSPRFDPNRIDEEWKQLNEDPGRPLVDRALQGRYPPGSVFKVIVAAAALEKGVVTPQTVFDDPPGGWLAGGYRVNNYDGKSYGEHTFADAFAKSVNTTFAKVGVQLGAEELNTYAHAFGFGQQLPWRLGGSGGSFPDPAGMDKANVAQASFGQSTVSVTPMQMALVAAGVANGGQIMRPYVVSEVRDYNQQVLEKTDPSVWLRPISPTTAATLRDLMVKVVQEGTGTRAAIEGVQVAGKTGTAEIGGGVAHSWFVGFAPADAPRVAVAVVVEKGTAASAPIARDVMAAALDR
jgi:peptidoglycan glycosyltransferase